MCGPPAPNKHRFVSLIGDQIGNLNTCRLVEESVEIGVTYKIENCILKKINTWLPYVATCVSVEHKRALARTRALSGNVYNRTTAAGKEKEHKNDDHINIKQEENAEPLNLGE